MKIKGIHINKFRVFENFDIDFCKEGQPQNLIVLAGINGSGKTTLLSIIEGIIRRRIIQEQKDADLTIRFIHDNEEKELSLKADAAFDNSAFMDQIVSLSLEKETMPDVPEGATIVFRKEKREEVPRELNVEREVLVFVDHYVYDKGVSSFLAYDDLKKMIGEIFEGFDFQAKFLRVNGKRKLVFKAPNGEEIGLDDLSSGEKTIYTKIFPLFLADVKDSVIIMDEPEGSLHPEWQMHLLPILRRCAEKFDAQIIIATHSPQIISSAHSTELRLLVRGEDGRIRTEVCEDGPYGWTVERVLYVIQNTDTKRVPDVDKKIKKLYKMFDEDKYESPEFETLLSELENLLSPSDVDLLTIRAAIVRKQYLKDVAEGKIA